jgi:anti-sigma regulatory factor (Ser/Thr protein kinase)
MSLLVSAALGAATGAGDVTVNRAFCAAVQHGREALIGQSDLPFHRPGTQGEGRSPGTAGRWFLTGTELVCQIHEHHGVMHLVEHARYRVRTLEEARCLAAALGAACTAPERAGMGIAELLVNAIEHGNLGITFEEKAELLSAGRWKKELDLRLALAENAGKCVEVGFWREGAELVVRVRDQGKGFDPMRFLSLDETRAFYPNGRGIALARQIAFASIQYVGCGNEVEVRLPAAGAGGQASLKGAA